MSIIILGGIKMCTTTYEQVIVQINTTTSTATIEKINPSSKCALDRLDND